MGVINNVTSRASSGPLASCWQPLDTDGNCSNTSDFFFPLSIVGTPYYASVLAQVNSFFLHVSLDRGKYFMALIGLFPSSVSKILCFGKFSGVKSLQADLCSCTTWVEVFLTSWINVIHLQSVRDSDHAVKYTFKWRQDFHQVIKQANK